MNSSSETVLTQVEQVRFKKGDGTLYVMSESIGFMLDRSDSMSVTHKYADIKLQKISPEGKSKIQLQLVLHGGNTTTFHFVNRDGQEAQIRDRNIVKEKLQQLLPKFKQKVDKELEVKNSMPEYVKASSDNLPQVSTVRISDFLANCSNFNISETLGVKAMEKILKENTVLLQLYRDLVITEVVSSEEFWAHYATEYTQAKKVQHQEIGVNSAFLADIKPQTDGCNGLKYNLTKDVIECIFKTYPAVKRKHQENVPHKMQESEFWTKFFQSHYFHRDRINAGTKDLFTECAKIDDQEMKKDLQTGINDPLLDIASFEDTGLDENYGSQLGKADKASGNIVHQSMIKRFNQHSIMVMKASTGRPSTSNSERQVNGSASSASKHPTTDEPKTKKLRIQEKLVYDDLDSNCDVRTDTTTPLKLTHIDRYLHGPVPGSGDSGLNQEDIPILLNQLRIEVSKWGHGNSLPRPDSKVILNSAAAVVAFGELTPGGTLMKGFREDSLGQLLPKDLEKELRNIYVCLCELLNRFWRSFPPTTPQLEERAIRMHEALQRFHSLKLKKFEDKIHREFSAVSQHLTSHLNQVLNAAYRKFADWQQRKMQMR